MSTRLLGGEGLRRAYPLVRLDRPELDLASWLAEAGATVDNRDRPLDSASDMPRQGIVGIATERGCVFAVFGYRVIFSQAGSRVLEVRGPSSAALLGAGLIADGVNRAIDSLLGGLGCTKAVLRDW